MKLFLSVASTLIVLLGLGWLIVPDTMLARWGTQSDAMGAFIGRRYGAVLLGYATILWLGRAAAPSAARTAILGGGALVTALVCLLSLGAVVTGTIHAGGWVTVGIEALLAAGFVFYFVGSHSEAGAGKASSGSAPTPKASETSEARAAGRTLGPK